jgi:peptidase M48-like protein
MSLSIRIILVSVAMLVTSAVAQSAPPATPQLNFDQFTDRLIQREHDIFNLMRNLHPVAETYIQDTKPDAKLGAVPVRDQYYLGQLSFKDGAFSEVSYMGDSGIRSRMLSGMTGIVDAKPSGVDFARTLLFDPQNLDRKHYNFTPVRSEMLGDVRCFVIDVQPQPKSGNGRFLGRIWVEDQDYHIVRMNGTYVGAREGVHFETWRLNVLPHVWLPAYSYSEEPDEHSKLGPAIRFKALTRIWGYDLQHAGDLREYAAPLSDEAPAAAENKKASGYDLSGRLSARPFQYSTEDNIIERLQVAGLMAPTGDVDQILETVTRNLVITNELDIKPEVRCRVLLTAPLESFSFGHVIVVSRGLLDVLPDEATLAAILAHELAHIALNHSSEDKYASWNSLFFPNDKILQKFDFRLDPAQEEAANRKAAELLAKSPYKDKLTQAGLFLKTLQLRSQDLPNLIHPHLGNALNEGDVLRLAELTKAAPEVDIARVDQISALPLGSRVKIHPWNDRVELIKTKAVPLHLASEKIPFEITPVFPYLKRVQDAPLTPPPAAPTQ